MLLTLSDRELEDISSFIKVNYGVNLASRKALIEGRLGCYVAGKGFSSFGEYFDFAKNEPTQREMTALIGKITTNHTFFMRERDHFDLLAREVLPWIAGKLGERDLRIWCAGCATGEEPYALSIHILEYFDRQRTGDAEGATGATDCVCRPNHGFDGTAGAADPADTTILASDISERALKTAADGVFSAENLTALPRGWIQKYFERVPSGCHVAPRLRGNVAFRKINLMEPFSFSKPFQVIFCRNVMIYFDIETKADLVERFYEALLPGGYFFLGYSESLTMIDHRFDYVQPSVYRKPEAG
jgi:chemotaxis protein methyltransferase CheR